MALECQGTEDSSEKNSVLDYSKEEGFLSAHVESDISCAGLRSDFDPGIDQFGVPKKEIIESAVAKEETELSDWPKESLSDGYGSSVRRSITDLPSALVSEILCCLDAKELAIVSCVSTLLHSIASNHCGWKEFYCERWGLPFRDPNEKSWKKLFEEREFRSRAFMGRYSIDILYGHTEAVRAVFILPPLKLIFTGGYDSVIHMWDMEEGLTIASSRPLGCTIRAVVADTQLLVVGGTDSFLQCWRGIEGFPHVFDIRGTLNQSSEFKLWGHEGPVTCLALDPSRIYSGSWDMTVRVWDRAKLKCLKVLRHGDWVWSLVPHGTTIASTASGDVYVWDIESGSQIEVIQNAHTNNAYSLARSYSGNFLFTGGEDGAIHMFELVIQCGRCDVKRVATWIPHTGPVHSLAFEFPWLVSSSSDGRIGMIDIRKLLKSSPRSSFSHRTRAGLSAPCNVELPQRMLHGFGCNLFSVGIGADRIVCAGEEGVVRIWNFSDAIEIEQRIQALRGIRLENRMRRRKIQLETRNKNGRGDQCSTEAKRNQIYGDRNGVWRGRRSVTGKLKA